jgi:hypothetical protein
MFNSLRFLALSCLIAVVSTSASSQEKTGVKPGFELRPGSARILLMQPVIRVGEQSTGGMFEPNADWTMEARQNILTALKAKQVQLGNEIIPYDEGVAGDGGIAVQYEKLFGSLASSVVEYQFFAGNRLPTKKRKNTFDWGLGPGIKSIPKLEGADYALFIWTMDQYGSTGRKLLQAAGFLASAFGVPVGVTSGVHKGYAGLVDLKTGDLVWLNADLAMGGDVRAPDGAEKRVQQLLEGFPGRRAEGQSVSAPK